MWTAWLLTYRSNPTRSASIAAKPIALVLAQRQRFHARASKKVSPNAEVRLIITGEWSPAGARSRGDQCTGRCRAATMPSPAASATQGRSVGATQARGAKSYGRNADSGFAGAQRLHHRRPSPSGAQSAPNYAEPDLFRRRGAAQRQRGRPRQGHGLLHSVWRGSSGSGEYAAADHRCLKPKAGAPIFVGPLKPKHRQARHRQYLSATTGTIGYRLPDRRCWSARSLDGGCRRTCRWCAF